MTKSFFKFCKKFIWLYENLRKSNCSQVKFWRGAKGVELALVDQFCSGNQIFFRTRLLELQLPAQKQSAKATNMSFASLKNLDFH